MSHGKKHPHKGAHVDYILKQFDAHNIDMDPKIIWTWDEDDHRYVLSERAVTMLNMLVGKSEPDETKEKSAVTAEQRDEIHDAYEQDIITWRGDGYRLDRDFRRYYRNKGVHLRAKARRREVTYYVLQDTLALLVPAPDLLR